MNGERLYTDIAWVKIGLTTILVLTGETQKSVKESPWQPIMSFLP
jgi:ribonucleotide monophosphatase NagD (HAD superfamily)